MSAIIDLRNKNIIEAEEVGSQRKEISISWSAKEYEKREREVGWHIFIGALALGLVILGLFQKSYFFTAFSVLAYLIFFMFEKRTPSVILFTISSEGVKAGNTLHNFSELKSFWIFRASEPNELSLRTEKTLFPFLRVPLVGVDVERARMLLRNFLPEEEHQELLSDHIEKKL